MPRPSRVLFLCLLIIIVVFLASYKFGDSEQKIEKLNQYRGKGGQDQEFRAAPGRSKDVHNSTLGVSYQLALKIGGKSFTNALCYCSSRKFLSSTFPSEETNLMPSPSPHPLQASQRKQS